ncbi:MAG: trimeric intracellular cation channel family protein, partial [Cyanobium sp.]
MPNPTFQVTAYFDYSATFLWALSGALLAARKAYAIPGILTVSFVSSVGGGLLRDGLFLQNGPPMVVRTPGYLGLIGAAVVVILTNEQPGIAARLVLPILRTLPLNARQGDWGQWPWWMTSTLLN